LGQLLLVVLSTFLTFVFLEIGLQIFLPQYGNYVQPDDAIEYSFIPGADYVFIPNENCPGWGSSGRINSHGLRDREYDYSKPPGTFRILALGDSYTESFQFDLDKTWPKLLERRLNEQGSRFKYEVINAGRSAMGTGTEYLYYLNKGRNYNPDLVLVLFVPNDFKDDSREFNRRLQPYFFVSEGKLILDATFTETWPFRLRKWIHPFKAFHLVSFTIQAYNRVKVQLQETAQSKDAPSHMADSSIQTAVEVTQRLLVALSQAVTQHGGRFAIVIGTANYEVNWTGTRGPEKNHDFLTSNADQIIVNLAQRERVPYLNLEPVLQAYSSTHRVLIHGCSENGGGGHWSQAGHVAAAAEIYDFLVNQGLVP
jgi:lysophospholipase L1-like esterase